MSKNQRVLFSVYYFLIMATFIYIFSGILGLNLPQYYPELGVFSWAKLAGPSMGYYGRIGFTLLLSIPLSCLFYLFLLRPPRILSFKPDLWRGLAVSSLLFGIMFFVAEEGHKWGIAKQGLDGGGFWNVELGAFAFLLVLFLFLWGLFMWFEDKGQGQYS